VEEHSLGVRRPAGEPAAGRWVCEREVVAIAASLVRAHGRQAARRAAGWADLMLARGDRGGHAAWRRIMWASDALQDRGPREAPPRGRGLRRRAGLLRWGASR
jgi:hypothetical protein